MAEHKCAGVMRKLGAIVGLCLRCERMSYRARAAGQPDGPAARDELGVMRCEQFVPVAWQVAALVA